MFAVKPNTRQDRAIGSFVGLAVGDAIGSPVEYLERGTFDEVTGYQTGGYFGLKQGQWTGETSGSICLSEALLLDDPNLQYNLLEYLLRWYREGVNSSSGACFDIGSNTRTVLDEFESSKDVSSASKVVNSEGSGSLTRLAPVAVCVPRLSDVEEMSETQTRATHPRDNCVLTSRMLGRTLHLLIKGIPLSKTFNNVSYEYADPNRRKFWSLQKMDSLVSKDVRFVRLTGWCVDTLNAAVWCFRTTSSFEQAVLKAANLGGNAGVVCSVVGQLAGAYYGLSNIPRGWVSGLQDSERLINIGRELYAYRLDHS